MAPEGSHQQREETLRALIRDLGSVAIGFSGGADSALLLKVAFDELGDRAIGITAVSPSLAESDRLRSVDVAREIGAPHLLVESHELDNQAYVANAANRCFFCKQELFDVLWAAARERGFAWVAYGAITDDLGDFRPGMDAARRAGARAPLLEAGLSKGDVREISRRLGLSTWDRPASACLSSRIAHGTPADSAHLARVEACEEFLRSHGVRQVRVRLHEDLARIECAVEDVSKLAEPAMREALVKAFKAAGVRFVTLDLEGYRSGSLNPIPAPVRRGG